MAGGMPLAFSWRLLLVAVPSVFCFGLTKHPSISSCFQLAHYHQPLTLTQSPHHETLPNTGAGLLRRPSLHLLLFLPATILP